MNFNRIFKVFVFISILSLETVLPASLPTSCAEIGLSGERKSGIYTIHPRPWFKPHSFRVYCDLETDGGGWTVFQRRDDIEIDQEKRENFYRNWTEYKNGFGDLEKEFWLGNEYLYILTSQDSVTLRVNLHDFEGNSAMAEYSTFRVSNEKNNYTISVSGYNGTAGDALTYHDNSKFVTYDRDNSKNCSVAYKGGWWYSTCYHANLNGLYQNGKYSGDKDYGIEWYQWKGHWYSLKATEMKFRPIMDEYYSPFNYPKITFNQPVVET